MCYTFKKRLKKRKKEAKKKTVTKSTTDPDAGMFVKGDHKKQMAYEAHTVCNQHGYVLEVEVTPGNVHDSVAFDDVYEIYPIHRLGSGNKLGEA